MNDLFGVPCKLRKEKGLAGYCKQSPCYLFFKTDTITTEA
jgi:hypothetical protein